MSASVPGSARLLLPADSSTQLQWANLSPETKKMRAMQQEVAQLAISPDPKNTEGVLQNAQKQSAGPSTEEPAKSSDKLQEGAAESSVPEKFYSAMTSLVEVLEEKESAGSTLKWDRKAPVIKAESPKTFMSEFRP